MKLIKGSDFLALAEGMARLKGFADSIGDGERMNKAIRDGCAAGDAHLACSFPDCTCKQTPAMIRAAIQSWEFGHDSATIARVTET